MNELANKALSTLSAYQLQALKTHFQWHNFQTDDITYKEMTAWNERVLDGFYITYLGRV